MENNTGDYSYTADGTVKVEDVNITKTVIMNAFILTFIYFTLSFCINICLII